MQPRRGARGGVSLRLHAPDLGIKLSTEIALVAADLKYARDTCRQIRQHLVPLLSVDHARQANSSWEGVDSLTFAW